MMLLLQSAETLAVYVYARLEPRKGGILAVGNDQKSATFVGRVESEGNISFQCDRLAEMRRMKDSVDVFV